MPPVSWLWFWFILARIELPFCFKLQALDFFSLPLFFHSVYINLYYFLVIRFSNFREILSYKKYHSKNSWTNLGIFCRYILCYGHGRTSTQPTGRIGSQKFSEKLNSKKSKNEIKRPGECAFSRGNWCDYEQDPDDDLDWSISSDGYALILLNQHQKLQYGRLLSPFIRSKVSYKSFLVNFLLIFDGFYCYPWLDLIVNRFITIYKPRVNLKIV